jgi:23S rRNA (uracil1939-C5)-methyltransferase
LPLFRRLRRVRLPAHRLRAPARGQAAPAPFGYRNRIRVHCAGGVIGFVARDQRTLVDIDACAIASENVNAQLAAFRAEDRPKWDGDRTLADRGSRYFEQTNDAVAALVVAHIAAAAARGGALVDAYCGAGLFAKALAGKFGKVIGIESNPRAVRRARAGAGPGETYFEGDVQMLLEEAFAAAGGLPVTLVVDPPAAGLAGRVIDLIAALGPEEIFYVSCDPATLARDVARLGGSHAVAGVQPFDMFPQTAEIEVVVRLLKRGVSAGT